MENGTKLVNGYQRIFFALKEQVIEKILALCAYLTILTTLGIIFVLLFETIDFFKLVTFKEFFLGTEWEPLLDDKYGILPLLSGTILIVVGSGIIAIPLGLLTAIFLNQFASNKTRIQSHSYSFME